MHTLFVVAMAFVVPLLAIAVFILLDQGLTSLAKYLQTKFDKRKADTQMKANSSIDSLRVLSSSSNTESGTTRLDRPINPDCKKCAGCKLATTGGCGGRKKPGKKSDV